MKILVIGGAGYIGTVLTELLLDRGDSVCCYDTLYYGIDPLFFFLRNPLFDIVQGDLLDGETLRRSLEDVDAICHLAALVGYPACKQNPKLAYEVNVEGTKMLNQVRAKDQLLVFASTCSIYGTIEDGICTEEMPLNPPTIYGQTKLDAEKILLDSGNAISYRLATAFGLSPRLRLDLLINDFCYQAVRNRSLIIYEAQARRSFIDVYDIARAFIHALDNYQMMRGEVYNCGDEKMNASKLEVAKMIQKQVDFYLHTPENGKDEDGRNYYVSYEKIHSTGFQTSVTLEEGIKSLVKAFKFLRLPNSYSRVF